MEFYVEIMLLSPMQVFLEDLCPRMSQLTWGIMGCKPGSELDGHYGLLKLQGI